MSYEFYIGSQVSAHSEAIIRTDFIKIYHLILSKVCKVMFIDITVKFDFEHLSLIKYGKQVPRWNFIYETTLITIISAN